MAEERENIFKRAAKKLDRETDKPWFPALYGACAGALVGLVGWACGARQTHREVGRSVDRMAKYNKERVADGLEPVAYKFFDGPEIMFVERDIPSEETAEE